MVGESTDDHGSPDGTVDIGLRRQALLTRVRHVRHAWQELDVEDGIVAHDLRRLEERVVDGQASIGVFGLFKRGKSTLVNALIGQSISPTAPVPETAVPVVVEHGDGMAVEVVFADGRTESIPVDDVRRWCTQQHNHGNHRGVAHVRWRLPHHLLASGVRIIDTPGLDDAHEHYTRRTLQQLGEVDAGLVVVSSPPTIGATEIGHLRALQDHHGDRLVVVCNIHEHHADDPDTVAAVVDYVRARTDHVGDHVRVVPVCASRAFRAALASDEEAWRASGGAAVLDAATDVAARVSGARLLDVADAALDRLVEVGLAQLATWTTRRINGHTEHEASTAERARDVDMVIGQVEAAMLQAHFVVNRLFDERRGKLTALLHHVDPAREVEQFAMEVDVRTSEVLASVRDRVERTAALLEVDLEDGEGLSATLGGAQAVGVKGPGRGATTLAGLAGTVGLAAAGLALGPLGLLGGALVGWRVGDLAAVTATGSRRDALRRLDEVRDAVLEDLDHRGRLVTEELRRTVTERLDALERDRVRYFADRAVTDRVAAALRQPAGEHAVDTVPPQAERTFAIG